MGVPFSIVWLPCGPDSPFSKLAGSPRAYLPFFVEGDQKHIFDRARGFIPDYFALVRGILVAYLDDNPTLEMEPAREQMLLVLRALVPRLHRPSLDVLVVDTASDLRKHHGCPLSRSALLTGLRICPESATVRSDLIADTWMLLELDLIATEDFCLGILDAFDGLDPDRITLPAGRELALYAVTVALTLSGQLERRDRFVREAVVGRVSNPSYSKRLSEILSAPSVSRDTVRLGLRMSSH